MISESAINIFWNSPIGPFLRDISVIGRGGFGTVYKAYHTALNRTVAVKVLNSSGGVTLATEDVPAARFMREARALERINHPNIVRVYACGMTTDGLPYMVMEYLVGDTITTEIMNSGNGLPVTRAREILLQVAQGVGAMHRHGIVHRDLTPSNCIMIHDGEREVVKIFDFGLVKSSESDFDGQRLTRTFEVCGTVSYIPPEVWLGHRPDELSDIYSLGCFLYQMVTGHPPFVETIAESCAIQHVHGKITPVYVARRERVVYPELEEVISKSLEKSPTDRYRNTDEMIRALDNLDKGAVSISSYKGIGAGALPTRRRLILFMAMGIFLTGITFAVCRTKTDDVSARISALEIENAELSGQITPELSAHASERSTAAMCASRKHIFEVRSQLGQHMAKQFFDAPDLHPSYRFKASNVDQKALAFSDCLDDTMRVMQELSELANMKPKEAAKTFTPMCNLWAYEASHAAAEARPRDALVFYRAYLVSKPTSVQQRIAVTSEVANSCWADPKLSRYVDQYGDAALKLLREVSPNSVSLPKMLLDVAGLSSSKSGLQSQRFVDEALTRGLHQDTDAPAKAELLLRAACIYHGKCGEHKKAIEFAERALALCPEGDDKGFLARCWEVISLSHTDLRNYRAALLAGLKSAKAYHADGNSDGVLSMHARVSYALLSCADAELTHKYLPMLLSSAAVPSRDSFTQSAGALLSVNIARNLLAINEDQRALKYLEESLARCKDSHGFCKFLVVESLGNAACELAPKHKAESHRILVLAASIAETMHDYSGLINNSVSCREGLLYRELVSRAIKEVDRVNFADSKNVAELASLVSAGESALGPSASNAALGLNASDSANVAILQAKLRVEQAKISSSPAAKEQH